MADTKNEITLFEQRVRRLLRHPSFLQLRRRKQRFRPFQALGIEYREHSHSDFLAYLLDPKNPHGFGDHFLREFIALVADSPAVTRDRKYPLPVSAELTVDSSQVSVARERNQIDILIDCYPKGPVIGIEVKIWASEQEKQLQRYQDRLLHEYPDRERPRIMVFLTPNGNMPGTATEGHDVPCVLLSWGRIADSLEDVSRTGTNEDTRPFIEAFSRHIKESFMGNSEDRELAGSLFKDPELVELFQSIESARPRFWDPDVYETLKSKCEEIAVSVTGERLTSPKDSDFFEGRKTKKSQTGNLFLIPVLWKRHGLPICFCFYHEPEWQYTSYPGMHVVMYSEDTGDMSKGFIDQWEKYTSDSDQFSDPPKKIAGWGGAYSVFSRNYIGDSRARTGWVFRDESFDEEWVDKAAERFRAVLTDIHDEIKGKLAD